MAKAVATRKFIDWANRPYETTNSVIWAYRVLVCVSLIGFILRTLNSVI